LTGFPRSSLFKAADQSTGTMADILIRLAERVTRFRNRIAEANGREITVNECEALRNCEDGLAADCDALDIPLPHRMEEIPATIVVSRFQVEYRPVVSGVPLRNPGRPEFVFVCVDRVAWPRMMDGFALSLVKRAQFAAERETPPAGGKPQTDPSLRLDPAMVGKVFLIESKWDSRTPTVEEIADKMGVRRTALYENKGFESVRKMARELFGMFPPPASKGDSSAPPGSKSKDGTVEAEAPAEAED
jgi:hypothetical protein